MSTPIEKLTNRVQANAQTAEEKDKIAQNFQMPTLEWLIGGLAAVVLILCAIFNWQFFTQAAPGALGKIVGVLALASGVTAFACWLTISKSAGKFQVAVGVCAIVLTAMDIVHATIQYYKNTEILTRAWPDIQAYAQFGAFPVLLVSLVASGFALTIFHWRHRIMVERARAAQDIQVSEARLQTAEIKMDNEQRLDKRRLQHLDDQLSIQAQTIERIVQFASNHQKLQTELAKITDPRVRKELEQMFSTVAALDAFEIPLPPAPEPKPQQPTGYVNGRAGQHPNQ